MWLLARTFVQKLCSGKVTKVQLPHFLSPTEALEGTLCLVMNLLCIVYVFDIQVWASRSHFKGCFSCSKSKTFKCSYLKITFSTYVSFLQNTAECLSNIKTNKKSNLDFCLAWVKGPNCFICCIKLIVWKTLPSFFYPSLDLAVRGW